MDIIGSALRILGRIALAIGYILTGIARIVFHLVVLILGALIRFILAIFIIGLARM